MQLRVTPAVAAMLEDLVQLAMFPGGYAGVCLVEGGIATICWVIDRDVTGEAAVTWDAHAVFLAQRSEFFATLLGGATPLWDKPVAVAAIPYDFLRRVVISDAVYPLGDQLVVIPSYTGDGTSIALHTGMAAAHAGQGHRQAKASDRLGEGRQRRLRQCHGATVDFSGRSHCAMGGAGNRAVRGE